MPTYFDKHTCLIYIHKTSYFENYEHFLYLKFTLDLCSFFVWVCFCHFYHWVDLFVWNDEIHFCGVNPKVIFSRLPTACHCIVSYWRYLELKWDHREILVYRNYTIHLFYFFYSFVLNTILCVVSYDFKGKKL